MLGGDAEGHVRGRPEQSPDRRARQGRRGHHRLHGRGQLLRALHQRSAHRRRRHSVHAVNSHVVRFRVKRPYTIAVLAQDWEDKLGLGMEVFQGNTWHSGDGGFVAKLSDGTVTDSTWKAQSFYIAPLQHPDDVVEYGNIHDTSHLGGRIHPLAKLPTCREHCFAIHYPIPDDWMNPNFDDSKWPRAFEYLDQEVGIVGVPGYWRYPEAFAGSRWIWTISLVFDNTVLLRKTVR